MAHREQSPEVTPLTVTVVLTCHNTARFLPDALASVIVQGSPEISVTDVVLVDDGSDDEPERIAREIIPTIEIKRHPTRRGIAAARNTGWRDCVSDAIAFLDSDDIWAPGSLTARALPMLDDPGIDVTFGRVQSFTGDPTSEVHSDRLGRLPGTMLIRTSARDRVGGFDESLSVGEMIDWVARANDAGIRFASVDDIVLYRRHHETNKTRDSGSVSRDFLRLARAAHARRA